MSSLKVLKLLVIVNHLVQVLKLVVPRNLCRRTQAKQTRTFVTKISFHGEEDLGESERERDLTLNGGSANDLQLSALTPLEKSQTFKLPRERIVS